jgi:hypothetical protein
VSQWLVAMEGRYMISVVVVFALETKLAQFSMDWRDIAIFSRFPTF